MIASDYVLELSNVFYSGQVSARCWVELVRDGVAGGAGVVRAAAAGEH
jgi:hypothetical protein